MSNQSNNEESLIQRIEELENEVQQLKSEIGFLKADGELQQQSTKSQSEEQRSSDCSNQSEVVEKIVTILYAKDSNDGFLRCVDHLEHRKSVYRLELVNSKEAKLFLCDKEDDKKRIIKEGVRILNSICDVTKKTNTPTEVLVKTHGIARCIEDNKWQVEKKIEVVLQ